MSKNPHKRPWYQFSLCELLVFVTIVALILGFWVSQLRPHQIIDATYKRLGARGAIQTGNADIVEMNWFQRPFLGQSWFGKCDLVRLYSEPTAEDFEDLRSVIKAEVEVQVNCPLSDDAVKMLAKLNIAALLVSSEGNLSHEGWEQLRGKSLRSLDVRAPGNCRNKFSGRELAVVSEFRNLESLSFDTYTESFTLTDRDFESLKPIPSLQNVCIRAHISDKALAFLSGAKLRSLFIVGDRQVPFAGTGLAAIKDIESLDLMKADALTDDALGAIAQWPSLRNLQIKSAKEITREGLSKLSSAERLESLRLDFGKFEDEDLTALAGCKNLKKLSLRRTKVSGPGLRSLAQLPLEELDLFGCPLSDDAIDVVAAMPGSFLVIVEPEYKKQFREKLGSRVKCEMP